MSWHYLEKEYYDYADDIEAVCIHYVCTALDSEPVWETQRVTRYMSVEKPPAEENTLDLFPLPPAPPAGRLRKKVLKLPSHLSGPDNANGSDRYHLHYYFEVWQGGSRHFSPLYTEEIVTNAQTAPAAPAENTQQEMTLHVP